MKKLPLITGFFLVFLLVGCNFTVKSNLELNNYTDDDIVAIVKGKEITIGDLRFVYPDEKVLENIDGYIKQELIFQEAKKMNLNLSKDIKMQKETLISSVANENNTFGQEMRQFIKSQANKLKMTEDEYLEQYINITTKQNAYISEYVLQKFPMSETNDIAEIDKYDKKVNEYLDELMKENEDEIEVFIK